MRVLGSGLFVTKPGLFMPSHSMPILETKHFAKENFFTRQPNVEVGVSNLKSVSLRPGFRAIYGIKEQVMVIRGEVMSGLCMHSLH